MIDSSDLKTIIDSLTVARIYAGAEFERLVCNKQYTDACVFQSVRDSIAQNIRLLQSYTFGKAKEVKIMTNFDNWLKETTKEETTESKRITMCRYYAECSDCPLLEIGDGDCTSTNPKVREWIESEVDT